MQRISYLFFVVLESDSGNPNQVLVINVTNNRLLMKEAKDKQNKKERRFLMSILFLEYLCNDVDQKAELERRETL